MHLPNQILAFASWASLVVGKGALFDHMHGSDTEYEQPAKLGLAGRGTEFDLAGRDSVKKDSAKYPVPPSTQCDVWIGIEVIYMVEITEICPEGSTFTETITECVSTLTRSICATPTTNRPCYPCIFSTPAPADDTVTVTVTSCSTSTKPTVTVTIQLCGTCPATTYVGTVPGYTPGGPCHGCSPYSSGPPPGSGSSLTPFLPSGATTSPLAPTVTVIDTTDCPESQTQSLPGVPGVPGSSSEPSQTSSVPVATHTPYRPTTASPPAATAGGGRSVVGNFGVWMVGWMMVGFGLWM